MRLEKQRVAVVMEKVQTEARNVRQYAGQEGAGEYFVSAFDDDVGDGDGSGDRKVPLSA